MLVAAFCLIFVGCNGDSEISSEPSTESSEITCPLGVMEALELIARDKLVTDIFINNSLCESVSAESVALTSGEYADFSEIEKLLSSTYTASGKSIDYFKSYPEGHTPSVTGIDGKTFVFNHIGSGFDDFIDRNSVETISTEDESRVQISAKTQSGREVTLFAVYENGAWLLETGVYMTAHEESELENSFPLSKLGSFMEFKGEILVIEFFISDNVFDFDNETEDAFHKRIESAFDYISEQSESYGNKVNITYQRARFDHAGVLGTRGLDFDIMFAETGFGSLVKFADANFDLAAYDNYVFAVCINNDSAVSHNGYEGTDETQLYFGERVIVGRDTTDVEICVSVLKLLGAYGYDEEKADADIELLYRTYFPHDIMVSESLAYSVMSPVTAYACGITDELSGLYRVFMYS